jgi:hypothetical protein
MRRVVVEANDKVYAIDAQPGENVSTKVDANNLLIVTVENTEDRAIMMRRVFNSWDSFRETLA